jgi:hypothetical protein
MKRFAFRLSVAALTFFLGISTVGIRFTRFACLKKSPSQCNYDAYFPVGAFSQPQGRADWFKKFYPSLMELPLSCLNEDIESYRLLFIPSFEGPASVRIWRQGDMKFVDPRQLHEIEIPLYGAKDLKHTESRPITDEEWNHFQVLLNKADFWSLPTENGQPQGVEGSDLLLEGRRPNQYHAVDRRSPTD